MDKRLLEIMNRKVEIRKALDTATKEQLADFEAELNALQDEEIQLRKKEELANKLLLNNDDFKTIEKDKKEERGANKTMKIDSIEYRNAFMDYVTKGVITPEFRDAAFSNTGENAAVIPTPTLDKIITKMETESEILKRVKRVAYPAGFVVPTSATEFTATWQAEGDAVETQKATTGKITFSAYQLRCAAGVTFQMSVKSLAAFESLMVENICKAMKKTLEAAIISGDGSGKAKGITKETPAKEVTVDKAFTYDKLVEILKAIPSAYKTDSVLIMNEDTIYDILAMTDKNGQPVARVTEGLDGSPVYKVLGKNIVVTDQLKDITSASSGDIVIVAFDLSRYVLNTGYDMDLVTYIDHGTRNKIYDSIMLVDGKVVDAGGLVFVKKK